jgi:hypothetical protein
LGRWTGVLLGIGAAIAYLVLGPAKTDLDSHYPIAQAFLAGRLHLVDAIPWLELVPRPEGGWYSPFPPLLSVLLVPFAATGVVVDTNHIAAIAGGLSVALTWELLSRLGAEWRARLGLVLAWAFGSEVLWVAAEGGQHLAPQVAAAALLLGALILAVAGRAPALCGLLFAAAFAARLPVGLAGPLLLALYLPRSRAALVAGVVPTPGADAGNVARPAADDSGRTRWWRGWLPFVVTAGIVLASIAVYNVARFKSPLEFGYGLIRNVAGESVLDEPWYRDGIVSLSYLPLGLHTMLLRGFEFSESFPWVWGSLAGTSVLLTMPILWWVFGARGRLAIAAGATAVVVLLPDLMHGNPGFAQIGYRFILDALPLLWLLLGLALRAGIPRPALAALVWGFLVNAWLCLVHWAALAPGF